MRAFVPFVLLSFIAAACSSVHDDSTRTASNSSAGEREIVLASEVTWEQLNPARPKSPKAGTLWGDRNARGPTGFLLRPSDGFESPPHIHNVSYRGVVIRGLIHNDDPNAGALWMPSVSFWTQPKGHVHITAAKGRDTLAYIEIDEGPYHVLPVADQFETDERPVNVDESNIVWVNSSDLVWQEDPGAFASDTGVKMAFLWGKPQQDQLSGTFVKLPAGFDGFIRSERATLRAVLIQGRLHLHGAAASPLRSLEPGSYFGSTGSATLALSCDPAQDCILYLRAQSNFSISSTPASN